MRHPGRVRVGRSRLGRWAAVPIGIAALVVLGGCTQVQLRGFLPSDPQTTNHTGEVTALWVNSWIVLLAVGLVTWGVIIWAAVVYRRRKGQTGLPVQLRYNMPIEIFYTVVPFILVIGFFAFTARDQTEIEQPRKSDYTITVYGKRWAWDFQYDTSGVYDQSTQARTSETTGTIDDSTIPTLYLPVNKKIQFNIESRDVAHSFWIVGFLYKKDMIPGQTNHEYVTPQRIGTYEGKCAELCGEYHSLMLFRVKVVSVADYRAKMDALRQQGNTGKIGDRYDSNSNQPGNGSSTTETPGGDPE